MKNIVLNYSDVINLFYINEEVNSDNEFNSDLCDC